MASNSTDSVQSSSSQPPAKTMSCLPTWISLVGIADAMVRGRAGRRDRIVHALDLEPGRQRRRGGRRHRLGHRERADALGPLAAGDVGALDDGARRRPAGAHDDAGALVGNFVVRQGRNRGSPAPWRRGSRPRRRRGSAWRGGRRLRSDRASARRAPGSGSRARHICRRARCRIWPRADDATTSCVLLPMDETMPIPVTTTRFICASPERSSLSISFEHDLIRNR